MTLITSTQAFISHQVISTRPPPQCTSNMTPTHIQSAAIQSLSVWSRKSMKTFEPKGQDDCLITWTVASQLFLEILT